jgi:hypothetical protein
MNVFMKIKCNEKLLVPKWNSLEINAKNRRNEEGQMVMDMKCTRVKK